MGRVKLLWQILLMEKNKYCSWRIASLIATNKMALIRIAIYICIKSVRHSVDGQCSSYQGDPVGSHLPSKFRSILLEMLSGSTRWALNLNNKKKAPLQSTALLTRFNWAFFSPVVERRTCSMMSLETPRNAWLQAQITDLLMLSENLMAFRGGWPNDGVQRGGTSVQ